MNRPDLLKYLFDWRDQHFGIRFGLWWIQLKGPKCPAIFSERQSLRHRRDGTNPRVVRLVKGWRILVRKSV